MFHGSLVALVTPMQPDGSVDYLSLRQLVDWHIAQQTDGIVVIGTTGESPTLTLEERSNIIQVVIEQAAKRLPVIAGTGTNCTSTSIQLTHAAMEMGVDACLLVTPYYNRPTQEGLYQHYRAIAEAVPIPQILYNVPKRTGCDLLPDTIFRLSAVPNIIGVKEGSPDRAREIIEACGNKISVFSGDDDAALEIIRLGGQGVISVAANIMPKSMHQMCQAALASTPLIEKANEINQSMKSLYANLFLETNPIPVKWAAAQMNLIPTGIRLPLTPLTQNHQATLHATLRQLNLVKK